MMVDMWRPFQIISYRYRVNSLQQTLLMKYCADYSMILLSFLHLLQCFDHTQHSGLYKILSSTVTVVVRPKKGLNLDYGMR